MFRFPLQLLLVVFYLFEIFLCAFVGPTDVIYKRMDYCDPPVNIINFWIEQWKVSRTMEHMNITLNTPIPIDDTLRIKLNGSMKKEGGWKPGAMYYDDRACKVLDNMLGQTFHKILSEIGLEDCPLPEGEYIVTNYYFNNTEFKVHQMYGEYKLDVTVYKTEDDKEPEILTCLVLYYNFDPKQDDED